MTELQKVDLDGGKYTWILDFKTGRHEALRHKETWRDLTGDNLIYYMGLRIVELEKREVILNSEGETLAHELNELKEQNAELLSLIYNTAIGELAMGYKVDIESMAESAFQITGISAEQLNGDSNG